MKMSNIRHLEDDTGLAFVKTLILTDDNSLRQVGRIARQFGLRLAVRPGLSLSFHDPSPEYHITAVGDTPPSTTDIQQVIDVTCRMQFRAYQNSRRVS